MKSIPTPTVLPCAVASSPLVPNQFTRVPQGDGWRRGPTPLACLALLALALTPFNSTAQNVLTNGLSLDGILAVNTTNTHTLTATKGDRIVVQLAKLNGGSGFTPVVEAWSPDGVRLAMKSDGVAARIDLQADLDGTYTILVHDLAGTGSGSYRVWLAQVPGTFETAVGDDGGSVTNGARHLGTLEVGDLDAWTIQAVQGDRIAFQISKTSGGAGFTPMIELFGPDGARIGVDSGGVAARLDVQALTTGTYTLLVSDFNQTGSGSYDLYPAQIPGAFTVGVGDEGGATVDGANQDGTIGVGDLDLWTFTASPGDLVTVQITEQSGGAGFQPMIELFAPNGERKRIAQGATGATLDVAVEVGGTYTVLVSDANKTGSGTYRLVVARGAIAPPAADVLTNGAAQLASISTAGQTNNWTFTATVGESVVVRMGETATGALTPWLRLYGPDGRFLKESFSAGAAEVEVRGVTNSGTFLVVAADGSVGHSQTGNYRIGLAKTGSPLTISPTDEGGVLTNGLTYLATIETGDIDTWTFKANAGESVVVRMGETATGALTPWLRLYGPGGEFLKESFSAGAAEVEVRGVTNSGTYTVVAADGSVGIANAGNYRLSLAKTGSSLTISPTDEGGALTNGLTYLATIDTGDIDAWTFTANAGESIVVRMGETATGALTPWLRLYGPDGEFLKESFSAGAAEVEVRGVTNSGTYTVVAADGSVGIANTGNYRLSLAKTGSQLSISSTDEGGALTNGLTYLATIDTGDIDAWTFTANAGESIVVRMGKTTTSSLSPQLRLYGPSGEFLDGSSSAGAAEVEVRGVTNSGTYTVVAADGSVGIANTGDYRISLAKTGSPLFISPTDEGGALTNGLTYLATIDTGDIDAWTFSANAGDSIVVRMGDTAAGALTPWLRLYGPDGRFLKENFSAGAAEVEVRGVTNSGTYTVVAADGSVGIANAGNYRISLAKTGSPLFISATDEGGVLTNGLTYLATIDTGDIDAWTFTANVGESIVVRMGKTTTSSLSPQLRLYGPSGEFLDGSSSAGAAEVEVRGVTNSGTYTVVAADGSVGIANAGNYRISLAKAGSPLLTSPGDEGGSLTGAGSYDGTIDTGDVDAFTFTVCAGEVISLDVTELTAGSALTPLIRLYGWDGELLKTVNNASSAVITNFVAPADGTYTLVIADGSVGIANSGTYRLTVNGLIDQLRFCPPTVVGTNALFRAIGGVAREPFTLLSSTNVGTPLDQWTPLLTNQFDLYGVIAFTNVLDRSEPHRFFRLRRP